MIGRSIAPPPVLGRASPIQRERSAQPEHDVAVGWRSRQVRVQPCPRDVGRELAVQPGELYPGPVADGPASRPRDHPLVVEHRAHDGQAPVALVDELDQSRLAGPVDQGARGHLPEPPPRIGGIEPRRTSSSYGWGVSPVKLEKYARVERERRFLLAGVPTGKTVVREALITDRYILNSRLRLRRAIERAGPVETIVCKLTQKIPPSSGRPALITTMYLSQEEYESLETLPAAVLRKTRYSIPPLGVDVFSDHLSGMILAEAEFEDDNEMLSFVPPSWVVAEVTHDERMTGGSLARLGAEGLTSLLSEYGVAGP